MTRSPYQYMLPILMVFLLSMNLFVGCASSSQSVGDDPYYKEIPWPESEIAPSVIGIVREHTTYKAYGKGSLTKGPKIKYYVKPKWPPLARQAGIEGDVVLELIIERNGRVESAEIIESHVTPAMDQSLLDAAKQFIYQPGKKGQKSVKCRVRHLIRWKLNGDVVKIEVKGSI